MDAIGFRLGHCKRPCRRRVDALYSFESNEYNGRTSLQLNLKDIKPAGSTDQILNNPVTGDKIYYGPHLG